MCVYVYIHTYTRTYMHILLVICTCTYILLVGFSGEPWRVHLGRVNVNTDRGSSSGGCPILMPQAVVSSQWALESLGLPDQHWQVFSLREAAEHSSLGRAGCWWISSLPGSLLAFMVGWIIVPQIYPSAIPPSQPVRCYLTRQKGLCRCDWAKDLEMRRWSWTTQADPIITMVLKRGRPEESEMFLYLYKWDHTLQFGPGKPRFIGMRQTELYICGHSTS